MWKRIRQAGLRTKILTVSIVFLLLNSLLCGVLCYTYVTRDTLRNYYQSSNDLLSQINTHLNTDMRSISQRVAAISTNSSIYNNLEQALRANDVVAYNALQSQMADVISQFQQGNDYISSLYIYTPLGGFENFTHIKRLEFDFTQSILYTKFQEDPNRYVAWYPAIKSPVFRDPETVIPVIYKVRMGGVYGYYIVSLYQRQIQNYLNNTYSSFDYLFIVDADGKPITDVSDGSDIICDFFEDVDFDGENSISRELDWNGTHYLATHTVMRVNNWRIYALRSERSLTGSLLEFRKLITLVLVLCLVISAVLVTVLVHSLTHPLIKLAELMDHTTQTRDFSTQAAYSGSNEVGTLTDSFNRLLSEINRLIAQLNINIQALEEEKETVQRVQAQKRKAEIKALQAQISPHFLYNTLNAISWQAADQGETEISVLSTALGRFFRISLSRGQEIIELNDEVEQVRSYLQIQKIRYKDILDYSFTVDPSLAHQKMVKLVVQPLVENAIYHGIKPADRQGHIHVSARRCVNECGTELIWITVEDDGLGIPPDKLAELNALLAAGKVDPDSGYGIFNVNERIKLYYGTEYGLMLESAAGRGTRATLVFPAQILEEPDEKTGV